ncbi:MAG: MBL fold metallo-hydrolase [Lachnospiraceae bacterium]|nr:MBL fold metallo-hydrolase [Lachnospiraceae bacterium]
MATIIQINENTWRIEDDGVRFFLFCGSEKAALIDSGMNTPDAKSIAQSLTDLPLLMINTHADPDHISGNGDFDKVYMSPAEEENYRENGGKGKVIPVSEGDEIDLGGRRLLIIDIPGHTPGSIALLDRNHRVLVSGDSVQDGRIFMFGKFRDLDLYRKSLVHLKDFEGQYDEIYPMHGTFPVYPELIGQLLTGAGKIADGAADGRTVNVFGNEVCLYDFPYAGFLCEQ